MQKIKILAIVGSLRQDSYNRQLAMLAQKLVMNDAEFEILDYDDIPFMNEDIEFPAPETVKRIREKVSAADGIWFFTPEYNHFFPGVLKNLIDWLSRPVSDDVGQVLSGKPAAISGVALGMAGTSTAQDHLVALLSLLNMRIMNVPRLAIPNAMQQLNSEGKLVLTSSASFLEKQAEAFIRFIRDKG